MRFVCTRWGDAYGEEYVRKLERGIDRNYSGAHTFECLEGDAGWPRAGCWPKLELFKPGFITGPTTYIDLDSVIQGSLDWLDAEIPHPAKLAMPQFSHKPGIPQACVIRFSGDNVSACYDREAPSLRRHDQSYLTQFWGAELGALPMGEVVSWKWVLPKELERASIVQFHGRKKPHHCPNDPIVKNSWL